LGRENFFIIASNTIDISSIEIGPEAYYWPYKVAPVADVTPYIIVNHQRISPIESSQRSASAMAERKGHEEQPFGVVDRVTISTEARETSRWYAAQAETVSPAPKELPDKSPVGTLPLLAYSPRQLK
jgi:hypothetical protein